MGKPLKAVFVSYLIKMSKATDIVLLVVPIICSIILTVTIYSEESLLVEFLSQAIYFLIAGIVTPLGILAWKKIPKSDDLESKLKHSENEILNALNIIKDGYYGEYFDKFQFLVPYPHSEYKEQRRKDLYPTVKEIDQFADDFANRIGSAVFDKKTMYEFVSLDRYPEAKLGWAMKHLVFYKDIKQKLKNSRKNEKEYLEFFKDNQSQIITLSKEALESKNEYSNELLNELHAKGIKAQETRLELQNSIDLLYHKLKNGDVIKGKCPACE